MGKKKITAMRKSVTPKTKFTLDRGVIVSLNGRIISPGESFSESELTPERLKELKEKGLIRGMLTTEEKGTITK